MVEVTSLIQATLLGIQIGMTLILITAGLTLIFGMMDVINIAHGALYMLGAYFGLMIVGFTGNFWLALAIAPLFVGVVGLVMEVFTVRPLYGRNPLYHILLTFGAMIVIEEVVSLIWGGRVRNIPTPELFNGSVPIGPVTFPKFRLFLFGISTITVLLIWIALMRTNFGVIMRASAHDANMIQALGIDVGKVFTGVFAIGAALAGFAGVLLGAQRGFSPTTGIQVIIEVFAIVVIGGLGSFRGAVAGALLVGLVQSYVSLLMPSLAELSIFVLMVLVLLVKPSGLFGGTVEA